MTPKANVTRLNAICPYFTMFPLRFPLEVLSSRSRLIGRVLDPFCGRGTTNFAARLAGVPSVGIDCNPVATAIAEGKAARATPSAVVRAARRLLEETDAPVTIPYGEFWEWAFERNVLAELCRLRDGLLQSCTSDARKALRAIILGALHGPQPKWKAAYFSNQCQRTYAPKPAYAVKFWSERGLSPNRVDVLGIIAERAERYFGLALPNVEGFIVRGDSRDPNLYSKLAKSYSFDWIITSPPYYGMTTYLPDQWLRSWFIGGPPHVVYAQPEQVDHSSPEAFAQDLRTVWRNVSTVSHADSQLVVRFGGINSRPTDPTGILHDSFADSGWYIVRTVPADSASKGRRQAIQFARGGNPPIEEFDTWVRRR